MKTSLKSKANSPGSGRSNGNGTSSGLLAASGARGENAAIPASDEFMKQLVIALNAVREGDFSVRLPLDGTGLEGRVAESLNDISARMQRFNKDLTRLRRHVGEEGRISERLPRGDAIGSWAERVEAI